MTDSVSMRRTDPGSARSQDSVPTGRSGGPAGSGPDRSGAGRRLSRRELNKIETRTRLLESARRLFTVNGVSGTTVEDVAAMVAWLLSRQAGFVTGQEFVVDGGMSKKMIYSE